MNQGKYKQTFSQHGWVRSRTQAGRDFQSRPKPLNTLNPEKIFLEAEAFNLASLEAIAAMKINVLFLRAKYRDYYDLGTRTK